MGKKYLAISVVVATLVATCLHGGTALALETPPPGDAPTNVSPTLDPSVAPLVPEAIPTNQPVPETLPSLEPESTPNNPDVVPLEETGETLPPASEVVTQSGFLDGEVSVGGAYVWWDIESMYFPSGCSRFNFYYENYTGIRLLTLEMNITDSTGNLIVWDSEIGINNGVTGSWSKQICAFELDAGPDLYNIEIIIKDYSSHTYTDSDFIWFLGASGTLDNFVMNLFYDFIGRPPTYDELSEWSSNLRYGTWSRGGVTDVMSKSDAYIRTMIYNFYIDTLGREPDQAGYQYWINSARSGRPIADIGSFFYGSDEYFQGFGHGNNADWIRDLYTKLMLRPADQGGLDYWVGQLSSGRMNRTQVAMWFYQSPEKRGLRVDALYQRLLGRQSDAGGRAYWANRLTAEGDIALSNSLASSSEYFYKQFRIF